MIIIIRNQEGGDYFVPWVVAPLFAHWFRAGLRIMT
jgi:hypothetical protein